MSNRIILLLLVLALPCMGAGFPRKMSLRDPGVLNFIAGPDPLLPYLVNQNFEGTGYDNSETWTEGGGGTIDEDEATVVGLGTQSLEITSAGTTDTTFVSFAAQSTVYAHFMFRYVSTASSTFIASFRSGATSQLNVQCTTAGALSIISGASATCVTTAAANTWYHVWVRYTQGTGADCIAELAFSTTTTRPTSGNNYATFTTGASTATADRLYLGTGANETLTMYYDQVYVDQGGFPQP